MPVDAVVLSELFSKALSLPMHAIVYSVGRTLAESFPGQHVVEGDDGAFDLSRYLYFEEPEYTAHGEVHAQLETGFNGPGKGHWRSLRSGWWEIKWRTHTLQCFLVTYESTFRDKSYWWIVGESEAVAQGFFLAVCESVAQLREEVSVFEGGCWSKSKELYASIRNATLDNVVLAGSLKEDIISDFERYLGSREMYERYGVPWKRGVLFIGPPGNGKTHTLKAVLNHLQRPCLYVKSFDSQHSPAQDNVRKAFEHARRTSPCVLVMEDLDSLVTPVTRSFFLNELDGFASNNGILLIATTNHPERLDASILDRPSRFDRKYHFHLPGVKERLQYLRAWNARWEADMQIDEDAAWHLAEGTEGFSFAYLKELLLSSMMAWIDADRSQSMATVMHSQMTALEAQRRSGLSAQEEVTIPPSDDEEDD